MTPNENHHKSLLRRGFIGSGIAAICCFTPFLVVIATGVGLSSVVGWLGSGFVIPVRSQRVASAPCDTWMTLRA